jgi:hypothetical protein
VASPDVRIFMTYRGSLQNKPNHAGKLLGIPVGTANQRKQAMIKVTLQKPHVSWIHVLKIPRKTAYICSPSPPQQTGGKWKAFQNFGLADE